MIAIIIPYYKLTFFEDTIRSLANQTDKRFRVYIGDDASPENPTNLLEKYKGLVNFVYHRFDCNLGSTSLVQQWKRCIALSNEEEWIMILGDDDYLEETVIASWYKHYNSFYRKSEVIRFASKLIAEEKNEISSVYAHPIWESATNAYLRKYNNETRSSLSEYIFSRSTYNKYHFFDYPLAWNCDDRAWLDFSDDKPIFTINESVVFIRLSVLNISGRIDNVGLKNESQLLFYKYLINKKLKFYEKTQQIKILRRYENEILATRNLSNSDWSFLLVQYVKQVDIMAQKKILKRFLNTILKRHEG